MTNIYDEVQIPQNIKKALQQQQVKDAMPWTQEQWDTLEQEYLKIQRKESKQSSAQRAKIVAQFENMLAYQHEWNLLMNNPQLRMKITDIDGQEGE